MDTLRPHQWVKNSFVVAPLVFAKHLFDWTYAAQSAAAFAAFCAISGAVYAFNDARDAAADRLHPVKRYRPVARGEMSERTALRLAAALAAVAIGSSFALSVPFGALVSAYAANNIAYTLWLKRYSFVDVMSVTSGFLLRVIAGALVLKVVISPWLLVCTGLLAALLGFGKRAHELGQVLEQAVDRAEPVPTGTRASLAGYKLTSLTWILLVLAMATCATYALYTRDARTIAYFGTGWLILSLPFCVVGIARFLYLALARPRAESPTDAILRDGLFLLNAAAWGAAVLLIIYWSGGVTPL